jgi:hypothetical protein
MEVVSASENLIDTAIGPIKASTTEVVDMDIDDHVHLMAMGMAYQLQIDAKVKQIDPASVKNRPPVAASDGTVIGGF